MCWSGQASGVLATVGLASTAYAWRRKEPAVLWISLGYFSLMEILQAFTYSVINQCSLPSNQIATLLGYLHITFQPFFINAVSMHFIKPSVARRLQAPVYGVCFVAAILMLIQLYPFDWAGVCDPRRPLCGEMLCSIRGDWHIAWEVPTNGLGNWLTRTRIPTLRNGFPEYVVAAFAMPLLYGSWRFTAYHLIFGVFLARISTSNVDEWPAIWCLFSIALLMVVLKTGVRRLLYVRQWPLWPKRWLQPPAPPVFVHPLD